MAQIFHPRFGLWVKLLGLGVLVAVAISVLVWRGLTAEPYGSGEAVEQIVPFSHKHHVGDDGIDCRYCHSTVQTDAFAGIPPVATCMTCHSQLYTDQKVLQPVVDSWRRGTPLGWQRVYNLPDFVYFNHAIHVAKGVGCVTCHGRIDRMPLTMRQQSLSMQWCLACHRTPENYLRPRTEVFSMEWRAQDQRRLGRTLLARYHINKARLTDCSICHR